MQFAESSLNQRQLLDRCLQQELNDLQMKRFFPLILVFILFFNSSCIHVNSTEHTKLNLTSQKSLKEIKGPSNLRINSVVYTESTYPLETFLKKLLAGDFNEAIQKVNLHYKPSNVDNRLLSELIEEGLVPVYVKIENNSSVPIEINEKNFFISDGTNQVPALNSKEIPQAFTRFNSKAAVANAYNIGVVAIVYIGVLVAIGVATQHGGGYYPGYGPTSGTTNDGHNTMIINPLNKTTVIDYQHYLLGQKVIEPFSTQEGLLFFRFKTQHSDLKLAFQ